MFIRTTLGCLLALAVAGCAAGFHRKELTDQVGVGQPVYDDKEIKAAFAKKANLPKPFSLAVYFKTPKSAKGEATWRWTDSDKKAFEQIASELKSEGLISDAFPIVSSMVTDEDLKSLRMVAARHHADALLIVNGAGETDKYINGWGWTYALLLPTLFVPGSQADTLFLTSASLWDVRNEYLYLTAEAESEVKNSYVAAFGKPDKDLYNEAKTKALAGLQQEIRKMIKGTKL